MRLHDARAFIEPGDADPTCEVTITLNVGDLLLLAVFASAAALRETECFADLETAADIAKQLNRFLKYARAAQRDFMQKQQEKK